MMICPPGIPIDAPPALERAALTLLENDANFPAQNYSNIDDGDENTYAEYDLANTQNTRVYFDSVAVRRIEVVGQVIDGPGMVIQMTGMPSEVFPTVGGKQTLVIDLDPAVTASFIHFFNYGSSNFHLFEVRVFK